ncbi:hypothetical protein TWF481_011832 [Arthrobotrys musiformis]|uniref:Aminoglycoside phosphotransferase domain-containing protein n=1 Tax=Arthrobotrys musiformis TaxID=47236 RepID=A0AAV9VXC1_9PEZI
MLVDPLLARFNLDFLRHPLGYGTFKLKDKASFFHVGCKYLLTKNYNPLDFSDNELRLHMEVLDFIEQAIPKIVDSRFDQEPTHYLFHRDLTEDNVICDDDSYITGIIDWEIATTGLLQEVITQPGAMENQLLNVVPGLFEGSGWDQEIVADAWKEYNEANQTIRDSCSLAVDRLDDSVLGDKKIPWTAGYKYITGLYQLAHQIRMLHFFSQDYNTLLKEEAPVRMFVLSEMDKMVRRAVELVEKDGVLTRTGP